MMYARTPKNVTDKMIFVAHKLCHDFFDRAGRPAVTDPAGIRGRGGGE